MATEMEPKNALKQLEELYQRLMSKDLTPDEEAQAKVQLLAILSSIKAHASIQQGPRSQDTLAQTNSLKELLLNWDPYGSAWFKEDKTLVNSVYNLLAAVKTLLMQTPSTPDTAVIQNLKKQIDELGMNLKSQIVNLQKEVATIKNSVIKLATAFKDHVNSKPKPQENPVSVAPAPRAVEQKPISLNPASSRPKPIFTPAPVTSPTPKPVLIPMEALADLAPKPISLPKPEPMLAAEAKKPNNHPKPFQTDRPERIPIPAPQPVPTSSSSPQLIPLDDMPGPSPIPLSGADLEEPISLDSTDDHPQLFGALSSTKPDAEKPNKEQLFNIFGGGSSAASDPSEHVELELEVSAPDSGGQPFFNLESQATAATDSDPETLYQELISLEGKRYSIERSIRDLKSDRENGILSDQEYKEKLSQLLNKLQTISKRIDVIRETLD